MEAHHRAVARGQREHLLQLALLEPLVVVEPLEPHSHDPPVGVLDAVDALHGHLGRQAHRGPVLAEAGVGVEPARGLPHAARVAHPARLRAGDHNVEHCLLRPRVGDEAYGLGVHTVALAVVGHLADARAARQSPSISIWMLYLARMSLCFSSVGMMTLIRPQKARLVTPGPPASRPCRRAASPLRSAPSPRAGLSGWAAAER
eukprot:4837336-Prymnesium_polylepis.1